ncbi:TspO/MBR family protein [Flaviaesturariibacter amylovorans]|uniref:TspO/MBR family protein n=1 Tax=Flaviaesturariibacter amylovorans TaxID=1084520 RepID=A0ABP8GQJ5_9BACT
MKNGWKLLISLVVPQAVAAAGAYFTVTGTGSWYQEIRRPSWNPPNWVFGPVWTLLYVLMGISLFLVWKNARNTSLKRTGILLWSVQLFFNFCWSLLFFRAHMIGTALVDLALLWLFLLLTIYVFSRMQKTAAWLLLPYIAWVTFAGFLNYAIYLMNR